MAKSIVSEGKTTNEAIEKGLKKLGCRQEDVDIKVLEDKDKKIFFSILDERTVKVELTIKENAKNAENKRSSNKSDSNVSNFDEKEKVRKVASKEDFEKCKNDIDKFLNEFCKEFGDITYKIEDNENMLSVLIDGEDSSKLIGYRGETINALINLLSAIGNKSTDIHVKVTVDIGDYKEKREATLKALADKLERTVSRTGKKITLEPMNAYERKIIHTALQNSDKVTTYSVGEEPRRRLVVTRK